MIDYKAILRVKLIAMFPDVELRNEAARLLEAYGGEDHEIEADRVGLGILKLAGRDIQAIETWIQVAKQDYRDVLASAEYPGQMERQSWRLPEAEQQRIEAEDREQYSNWIKMK